MTEGLPAVCHNATFSFDLSPIAREVKSKRRYWVKTSVGVEKVLDGNVFSAAMIAAAEFSVFTSAKRRLPQRVLSIG